MCSVDLTPPAPCSIGAIGAAESAARESNPDHVVGWNRLGGGRGPGGGGAKFFHRYVEQVELPRQNGHSLDRHLHQASAPSEQPALIDDELDLSLRRAHDVAYIADGGIIPVEQRQPDQIADPDGLREAATHFL